MERLDASRKTMELPTASLVQIQNIGSLLSLLVQAMVADTAAVSVVPVLMSDGSTTFDIKVADKDQGKIVGRDGRIARSMRIILLAIERQQKGHYRLNISSTTNPQPASVS